MSFVDKLESCRQLLFRHFGKINESRSNETLFQAEFSRSLGMRLWLVLILFKSQ